MEVEGRFRFFEPAAKKGSGIPLQLTDGSEAGEICGLVKSISRISVGPMADDGEFPHFQRLFRSLSPIWVYRVKTAILIPELYCEGRKY